MRVRWSFRFMISEGGNKMRVGWVVNNNYCMSDSPGSTTVLNKFLKYLGRNKMGHSFFRHVSTSLEKKHTQRDSPHNRYQSMNVKHSNRDRVKTLPSKKNKMEANQTVTSFVINEAPLGHSVRLIDPASPAHAPNPNIHQAMIRTRQLTFRDRMTMSKISSFGLDINGIETQEFFKRREEIIKTNTMDVILSTLTGNSNISKLRIYKERMRRFYNCRYSRQKLTSFFDYEYIEDYDSQLGYLETLLSLTLQEIHFLCFITMDINADGLVCNDDLFNIATVSAEENQLINRDVFRIFHYISMYQNPRTNVQIIDHTSDQDPAKDPLVTIQKYRLNNLKLDKQGLTGSDNKEAKSSFKKSIKLLAKPDHKGIVMTRKVNRHLFSLKSEEQQGEAAIKELRKRFAEYTLESRSYFKFKINFQRYQTIFKNTIPETYFDLLYVQGGVRVEGRQYCALNYDFQQVEKKEYVKEDFDRYSYFKHTVGKMRETFRRSRIEKFSIGRYGRNKST